MAAYGDKEYWDQRYTSSPARFDWYLYFWALEPLLTRFCPRDSPVLNAGVGLSTLQDDMTDAGWRNIRNIDVSHAAIDALQRTNSRPTNSYEVADVRKLPHDTFPSSFFGGVIDKGTLDSLFSGHNSFSSVRSALSEYYRVLQAKGTLLLITYGNPALRLSHLTADEAWDWAVEVYAVTKLAPEDAADALLSGASQPVHMHGPYVDAHALKSLEIMDDVVFVYACTKA